MRDGVVVRVFNSIKSENRRKEAEGKERDYF